MPPLSEERRRELAKVIGRENESARVSLRAARRDAVSDIKEQVKSGGMSEDEGRRMENSIQKITDSFIAEADAAVEEKKEGTDDGVNFAGKGARPARLSFL